jgi:hypothetical protein
MGVRKYASGFDDPQYSAVNDMRAKPKQGSNSVFIVS